MLVLPGLQVLLYAPPPMTGGPGAHAVAATAAPAVGAILALLAANPSPAWPRAVL